MPAQTSRAQHKTNKGFTLIELSVVLVIIGLLVGGVLMGRDLIHATEIRKTITEKEQFDTAVQIFLGKYNCLPGDCPNADKFFGATCGDATTDPDTGCNGDGDGLISNFDEVANQTIQYGELFKFWRHLSLAKLIPGSYTGHVVNHPDYGLTSIPNTNIPGSALNGNVGWNAAACANAAIPGDITKPSGNYFCLGGIGAFGAAASINSYISRYDAYSIDSKLDDGLPISGKVFGDNAADCAQETYFSSSPDSIDCTLTFKW